MADPLDTDHNPWLARRRGGGADDGTVDRRGAGKGGPETVQHPGDRVNLVWQTRPAPPTADENRLADALERIFADGVTALDDVVARLNAAGIAHPDGGAWSVDNYEPALRRLGE